MEGFDFTAAMRELCADIAVRSPEMQHVDVARLAISISQTRRNVSHGLYASLTPLRFENGAMEKRVGRSRWRVAPVVDSRGREYLYILSFYLPRFQNVSLEEKLSTVFHELWHISPAFDGDVRRHAGRCYAHGPSQRAYDALMDRFAQQWLASDPPEHLYEFLAKDFAELIAEHGRVTGTRWPTPKMVRA